MNPKLRQALQFIIFFGLGLGLIAWQFTKFTDADKKNFFDALRSANYSWFALGIFISALSHVSRAVRWQQLLSPLNHRAGLGNRYYAVMFGYLANYGLPRLGEVVRCGIVKERDEVPFSESFGTVIVERIIDMICLLLVFVLVLIFEFSHLEVIWTKYISDPAAELFGKLYAHKILLYAVIGFCAVMAASIFIFRKKIASKISGKFGSFLKGIKDGLLAVRRVPKPGLFIFHTLFIWSCYLFSLYVCFFCFPVTSSLTLNDALVILLFGTFGVIFTPGGIGLYQVIVTGVVGFLLYNDITSNAGASLAWLAWGSQVVTVIIFCGVAFFLRQPLNRFSK